MKFYFSFILLFINFQIGLSQTYINPKFEKRSNPRIKIDKIQLTNQYTIVHFKYIAPADYENGGWACASPDMYLQDVKTGKKLFLVKAKNIPVCPTKHYFKRSGETLKFQLFFPKVHHSIRYINIIEHAINGFNFYKIYLQPVA